MTTLTEIDTLITNCIDTLESDMFVDGDLKKIHDEIKDICQIVHDLNENVISIDSRVTTLEGA